MSAMPTYVCLTMSVCLQMDTFNLILNNLHISLDASLSLLLGSHSLVVYRNFFFKIITNHLFYVD